MVQRCRRLWLVGVLVYSLCVSAVPGTAQELTADDSYATRTLQCCWLLLQNVESRIVAPDTAYVKARVGFKNKEFLVMRGQHRFIARGFAEQEILTFAVRWEESRWRIDLFRILALSGVSLEFPGFYRPY